MNMALDLREISPATFTPEVLPILLVTHPFLTERLSEVTEFDDTVRADVAALEQRLIACRDTALGVAANQIGVRTKAFSINFAPEAFKPYWPVYGNGIVTFINARITGWYGEKHLFQRVNRDGQRGEGCLSVPGLKIPTLRYAHIRVTHLLLDGRELCTDFEDLPAVIVQHEADHPEGRLMLDNVDKTMLPTLVLKWFEQIENIRAGHYDPGYSFLDFREPPLSPSELRKPIFD